VVFDEHSGLSAFIGVYRRQNGKQKQNWPPMNADKRR